MSERGAATPMSEEDLKEKRKMQNRDAQRRYRERLRQRGGENTSFQLGNFDTQSMLASSIPSWPHWSYPAPASSFGMTPGFYDFSSTSVSGQPSAFYDIPPPPPSTAPNAISGGYWDGSQDTILNTPDEIMRQSEDTIGFEYDWETPSFPIPESNKMPSQVGDFQSLYKSSRAVSPQDIDMVSPQSGKADVNRPEKKKKTSSKSLSFRTDESQPPRRQPKSSTSQSKSTGNQTPSESHVKIRERAANLVDELIKLYEFGVEVSLLNPDKDITGYLELVKKRFRACSRVRGTEPRRKERASPAVSSAPLSDTSTSSPDGEGETSSNTDEMS